MAEWPRQIIESSEGGAYVKGPSGEPRNDTEGWVIPADLGRELYEAVVEELPLGTGANRPKLTKALARYEREVGDE